MYMLYMCSAAESPSDFRAADEVHMRNLLGWLRIHPNMLKYVKNTLKHSKWLKLYE